MSRELELLKQIIVYTDGACSGNPGPGGWGCICAFPDGTVTELGGAANPATNNQMEMTAALKALELIDSKALDIPITIFIDSTYVIRGITQWIWGWRSRGWKNAEGGDVSNRDIWEQLSRVVQSIQKRVGKEGIRWQHVRGHTGNPGNERCDEIAVGFVQKKWVDLYRGPLLGYSVAIHDFPAEAPLPEMKPKAEKVAAYSYLSFLNGEVIRHKDWGSCERRVKGQSGAKFKKAQSAEDEISILKAWGLSEGTQIK